jgi:hypothetical protein
MNNPEQNHVPIVQHNQNLVQQPNPVPIVQQNQNIHMHASSFQPTLPPPHHSAGFSVNPLTGVPDFSAMYNHDPRTMVISN